MKEENKILNIKFVIISIICICLFVIAIVPRELQNDTFYTIKLGKLILDNGIDMQEHFAWHEGLPYTYPHWLYDVGMYLISTIGGLNSIYISSIVLGCILGIVIYLTNAKLTKNAVIPFFTTILIMYLGRGFITARAQLVTFILFVLTVYNIERFLATKKKRFAIALLIIPTLIANMHVAVFPFYFVLYLPYIAEYLISLISKKGDIITKFLLKSDELEIKKLKKKQNLNEKQLKKLEILNNRVTKNEIRLLEKEKVVREPYKLISKENQNTKWLILIMVLAVLTGLLTPIGDTPYTYLLHTMQGNTTENISEHLPIILYHQKAILIYMAIAICLIAFTKVKIKLSDAFLLAGLMFLTIMSRRQESLLLFIGILVLNRLINTLIEMYDKDGVNEILKYFTTIIGKILFYGIFVAFMIVMLNKSKNTPIINDKNYPVAAAEYIKENLDYKNIKLYNEYNYGSYLLYQDIPVFIDSRADLYDSKFNGCEDDIFKDYINISGLNTDYEEKFEQYGITHLIVYKKSTFNKFIKRDENYNELYSDENFVVYERLTANKGE